MKYVAIISIIFSGYGFWQWLNRPETNLAQVELKSADAAVENIQVEKVKTQMSAQVKKVTDSSSIKKIPKIENYNQKSNEVTEKVEEVYTPSGDDKLLFELSNSGVDLDDISSAMEVIESSEGLSSEEYFEELISLMPAKTREIIENLIESKMIDAFQLKDFFDKYVNHGTNPSPRRSGRYPEEASSYEEESYLRDVDY